MANKIKIRNGTAALATTDNPLLDVGEPGYEIDTGRIKIGDGVTLWNSLPYFIGESDLDRVSEVLKNGEAVPIRANVTTKRTLVSGEVIFHYWRAKVKQSVVHVRSGTDVTAASGLTYAAIGAYSVDESTGDLTKIGDTGDLHASLWITAYNAFTSVISFDTEVGYKYAMAFLAVGTTPPALISPPLSTSIYFDQLPYLASKLGGQSSLPSTVLNSAVTVDYNAPSSALLNS